MLFIPLEKDIDWKRPPIISIALIIINVICYFGFQSNDNENYSEAMQYYFESGLSDIEIEQYKVYLDSENKLLAFFTEKNKEKKKLSKQEKSSLLSDMQIDGIFLNKLDNDQIIKVDDEDYKKWKKLSIEFNRLRNKATFYSYGLKNHQVTVGTLFSHMFLHGSFEHLFWNMVFLFVFGFSVEMILGWKIYLPTYLLAGLGSGLFYFFLEPNSAVPGIGASGAISGLTGMYTVLFGMRKIRFFYFVFVFFDTVKAPALIILPLWLGYELYNHYFLPTNINNLAHAGGLISGAVIAYLATKFHGNINNEYMDENNKNDLFNEKYAEALSLIAALKVDKARSILIELNQSNPNNIDVLKALFNLSKFTPNSDDFHNYARNILNFPEFNPQVNMDILNVYKEYIDKAKPGPKIKIDSMINLVNRFLKAGFLDDAEKIILLLIKNKVKHKNISLNLQMLINKYRGTNIKKADKYQKVYDQLFSEA